MGLTFYEKDFTDNYEELMTYYPSFYQHVYEMQEILKAQGKLADGIEAGIERAYLNNFIDYADAETIGNLEVFLKLGHNQTKELEMRRRIVKAHFVGNGKMSATLIKSMLQAYTEAEVGVELRACETASAPGSPEEKAYTAGEQALYITLFRDGTQRIVTSDILELLKSKLPAHLAHVLADHTEITADCTDLEKVSFPHMHLHVKVPFRKTEVPVTAPFWGCSEILLSCTSSNEKAGQGEVIINRNLHYFDGSLCFDGSTVFNSFHKKEVF